LKNNFIHYSLLTVFFIVLVILGLKNDFSDQIEFELLLLTTSNEFPTNLDQKEILISGKYILSDDSLEVYYGNMIENDLVQIKQCPIGGTSWLNVKGGYLYCKNIDGAIFFAKIKKAELYKKALQKCQFSPLLVYLLITIIVLVFIRNKNKEVTKLDLLIDVLLVLFILKMWIPKPPITNTFSHPLFIFSFLFFIVMLIYGIDNNTYKRIINIAISLLLSAGIIVAILTRPLNEVMLCLSLLAELWPELLLIIFSCISFFKRKKALEQQKN